MRDALSALEALGLATVGPLWLPLLIWTALASAVVLGLRVLGRSAHPLTHSRLLGATLAALPAGVLAAWFAPATPIAPVVSFPLAPVVVFAAPAVPAASASVTALAWPMVGLGALTALLGLGAVVGLGRLVVDAVRLARLSRRLVPVSSPVQVYADRLRRRLGIRRPVRVCVADEPSGAPFVYGLLRPTLVLPRGLDADLEAVRLVLLHEFAHVQHGDLTGRLLGAVVCALGSAHPLLHLLGRDLDAARERACDAAVLDSPDVNPRRYGALLLATAQGPAPRLAFGMAGASPLHQRLLAMNARSSRRPLASAFALLLGLGIAVAPVYAQVDALPAPPTPPADAPPPPDAPLPPDAPGQMPELIGGIQGIVEKVEYPDLAKKAGIEGRVFVRFDVGLDGAVSNAEVVKTDLNAAPTGDDGGLSAEALRVVRTLEFRPAEGQKVPYTFTLPITFVLPAEAEEQGALDRTSPVRYDGIDLTRMTPTSQRNFSAIIDFLPEAFARVGQEAGAVTVPFEVLNGGQLVASGPAEGNEKMRTLTTRLLDNLRVSDAGHPASGSFRLEYRGEG